jgi:hypothetical protein
VLIFSLCVGGSQVSVSKARSIIVLAEVENADQVIKDCSMLIWSLKSRNIEQKFVNRPTQFLLQNLL